MRAEASEKGWKHGATHAECRESERTNDERTTSDEDEGKSLPFLLSQRSLSLSSFNRPPSSLTAKTCTRPRTNTGRARSPGGPPRGARRRWAASRRAAAAGARAAGPGTRRGRPGLARGAGGGEEEGKGRGRRERGCSWGMGGGVWGRKAEGNGDRGRGRGCRSLKKKSKNEKK